MSREGGGQTFGQIGKIRDERMGFLLGIVLPHRDEKDLFSLEQGRDIREVRGHGIV